MICKHRLFVSMFEKVTVPAGDHHAQHSVGGRAWALPGIQPTNKRAVLRIQAVFRGRIARKRTEHYYKRRLQRTGTSTTGAFPDNR